MKRKSTLKDRGLRNKMPGHRDAGGFAVSPSDCLEARQTGPTTFSHINEVSLTKAEILRSAEAIRQAGCRDVLIISTREYVRFILTVKLPKPR
jgi:hypothetical protein